ncbi:MAG: tRNA (adenosine(37)-N6)-dimethylallyltransferase MiaA [Vampirovibrionales bacterium]
MVIHARSQASLVGVMPDYLATQLLHTQCIPLIVGSTCTGKTALGIAFAQWLKQSGVDVVILSADSRLVYQGLTIGTAKPSEEEQQGIVHEGIDLVSPTCPFTAQDYATWATERLAHYHRTQTIPIFVGGTGFYLQSALCDSLIPPVKPDDTLRQKLHQEALTPEGRTSQWERLCQYDPLRASQLHPNDTLRVVRALEVIQTTGKCVPQRDTLTTAYRYPTHWFNLYVSERAALWQRIETRTQTMLCHGWLEEVEGLVQQYGATAHALGVTHGYPELMAVLAGKLTLLEAQDRINIQVRQYAKRQQAWFKRLKPHEADILDYESSSELLAWYIHSLATTLNLPGRYEG